jgi:hypothetical protein
MNALIRRAPLLAVSIPASMLLLGCGPAVTETTAAPTVTIFLSAATNGIAGCFTASPDPATVGTGQSFNFRNNTMAALELIRRATGEPLTTAPAHGVSPTIVIHSVLAREDYFGKACASGIHTITIGRDSSAVALLR